MSDPIVVREAKYVRPEYVDKAYSYEELLDMFGDDGNLVHPLVKRCQQYEAEIERLRAELKAARAVANVRLCESCLEQHDVEVMCPPHECRTTGQDWFRRWIRKKDDEIERLKEHVAKRSDVIAKLTDNVKILCAERDEAQNLLRRVARESSHYTGRATTTAPLEVVTLPTRLYYEIVRVSGAIKQAETGDAT